MEFKKEMSLTHIKKIFSFSYFLNKNIIIHTYNHTSTNRKMN